MNAQAVQFVVAGLIGAALSALASKVSGKGSPAKVAAAGAGVAVASTIGGYLAGHFAVTVPQNERDLAQQRTQQS